MDVTASLGKVGQNHQIKFSTKVCPTQENKIWGYVFPMICKPYAERDKCEQNQTGP